MDSESVFKSSERNRVVARIKSSGEVKGCQKGDLLLLPESEASSSSLIVRCESSVCAQVSSVGRLERVDKAKAV